jgi:tetratricopeptide (TPR) repeat protein
LVPDWPCAGTAKRCKLFNFVSLSAQFDAAKEAYERVLRDNPNHAKVLQQLGWLFYQPDTTFVDQEHAIVLLTRSIEADPNDPQTWYLLGRCHMAQQKYNKAYESYQQAVHRDRFYFISILGLTK